MTKLLSSQSCRAIAVLICSGVLVKWENSDGNDAVRDPEDQQVA